MTIGFFLVSCVLAVGLVVGTVKINQYVNPMRRPLQLLFFAATLTVMFNAVAVVSSSKAVATFFYGLYFASADWLVIALLDFTKLYTDSKDGSKGFKALIGFLAAVDSVSMIVNVFTKHVFVCELHTLFDGSSCYTAVHKVSELGVPIYGVHLAFDYIMVAMILMMLFSNIFRSVKVYRKKYTMITWSFLVILTFNIGYRFLDVPIDVSPITYTGLALFSAYFALFYVSKSVVGSLLALSVEDMESAVMCFDRDGKCVHANEQCRRIFNAQSNLRAVEEYFEKWKGERTVEDFKEESWKEEYVLEDDETHYFEVHFKFLLDNKGHYLGSFFTMTDRTEAYRNLEIERYNATHDYLTDIYNRERFFEAAAAVLAEDSEIKRVVVCIDVKDFKVVNDLFGEETGNRILKRIAGLMRRDATHEDTRYGRLEADRFAMCMREEYFHEEDFEEYLEDLKKIINSSVYKMHVHVGVYHITDPTLSVSVMCDRAFVAIRRIKDNYQQIVSHYSENMGNSTQREKLMVGEFDRAIAAGEFQIYLQPQIAVKDYDVLGAEALVRWDHPVRGMISPAEFIPVFEKSGNIARLDCYVWELACRQLREWKEQGREGLHISVNISPKDFYFLDVYETLTSLIKRYEINPAYLKLEITETALMEELSKQVDLLGRLREFGFQVEIDDFGSGYSSLNTLQDIEVDVLKLDRGFLRKTTHEERSRTIMNSVIDMSKSLGLTVVTEGVETLEQVEYLTQAGCDIFQGYYFAKPMPVREFEAKYFQTAGAN